MTWDIFTGAPAPDYGEMQRRRERAIDGPGPARYGERRSVPPSFEARLAGQAAEEAAAYERRQAAYLRSINPPPPDPLEPSPEPVVVPEPAAVVEPFDAMRVAAKMLEGLNAKERREVIERTKAQLARGPQRDETGRFIPKPGILDGEP
jgi:hypothetical protein